jgi:hypothetical protein
MQKKDLRFGWALIELLSILLLLTISLQAQNYNDDSVATDTNKIDTSKTKTDTLGYNIHNMEGSIYALNINLGSSLYFQDSTSTDSSKTDSLYKKPDTFGYNTLKKTASGMFAFDGNIGSVIYLQDYSMTDTSKPDTSFKKTDTLGYKNIDRLRDISLYAFNGNMDNNYYLQDSSMTDTSKSDTSYKKPDTLGYNDSGSSYAYNENYNTNNMIPNKNMTKHFSVNPIKDLTQKLKEYIYLMDTQTPKITEILREYEARTYQSNGNDKELKDAANIAQRNIAEVLTIRQKKEWENSKDEWWSLVNRALNLSSISRDNL